MKVKSWRSTFGTWYEFDDRKLDPAKEYRATVQFPDGHNTCLPVIWEERTVRVPEHASWDEYPNYIAKIRIVHHGLNVDVPIEILDVVTLEEMS